MTDPSDSTPAPEIHSLAELARPPAGGAAVTPMLSDPAPAPPSLAELYAAFKACDALVLARAVQTNRLTERTEHVDAPEALFVQPGDHLSIHLSAKRGLGGRRFYGFDPVIEDLRGRELVDFSGRPCVEDRRRRDEIVAAPEAWCATLAAAREASGLAAAQAERDDAITEHVRLRDVIMLTPAVDLEDLITKAAVVAVYVVAPDEGGVIASEELLIQHRDRDFSANYATPIREWQLAAALLADLARLAEQRGMLPSRAARRPAETEAA